jgi:hypothetical protein
LFFNACPLDIFQVVVTSNDIEEYAVGGDKVDWLASGASSGWFSKNLPRPFQFPDLELEYRTDKKAAWPHPPVV